MITRTPLQVAKRALILGTMSFRASLEVTDYPRTVERGATNSRWARNRKRAASGI